jgi:hypothetical protein
MKTIGQEIEEAKKSCTARDLTTSLDRLKAEDGSIDYDKVEKLIKQLNEFGPYYKGILETIVLNLK